MKNEDLQHSLADKSNLAGYKSFEIQNCWIK